jgi:hypothetical protein
MDVRGMIGDKEWRYGHNRNVKHATEGFESIANNGVKSHSYDIKCGEYKNNM